MTDYKSLDELLSFSPCMETLMAEVKARLLPNRVRETTATGPRDEKGLNPFADIFESMPDEPFAICLANAVVYSWKVSPILIFPHEALVGVPRPAYPAYEHFHWGVCTNEKVFDQPQFDGKREIEIERQNRLLDRYNPLTLDHMHETGENIFGKEKYWALVKDELWWTGGYQGHTVPNYPMLLELGLDGLLSKISFYASKPHDERADMVYRSSTIILQGMSEWIMLYAQKAEVLAKSAESGEERARLTAIAENCAFVAHKAPQTLYQATQLMWFYCLWDAVDCVGRGDQYLYPFYCKAKTEGDVLPAEELILSIMLKILEHGVHNLTVGGQKPDGSDASNELSYLMLQILRRLHETHPRMSVRIHDKTEKELMALAIKMWSEGMSDPTVVGDNNVISGLTRMGVPAEDARDYTILGCQEIEIPGKSNFGCEDGLFNMARVLEYTLRDGYSIGQGCYLGLRTGKFEDFKSFEEFFEAYVRQMEYFTKHWATLCNRGQEIRAANFAKLVKTPLTLACIERGRSHDDGGTIYNFGVCETAGFAAVADSMVAIKKLVFDDKIISQKRLIEALDANFVGFEEERQLLLKHAPKFGNDDPMADEIASRVLSQFWGDLGNYRSVRGDIFTGACSLLEAGILFGKSTGALPDGRLSGEPLGNSIGPRPGADVSGVTAMLNSVMKLPLDYGIGGTTLNVILTTKLLSTPELRDSVSDIMTTYLSDGGQMAQITTANLDDLKDAQIHPERHGNLIIRIGGFSIEFVQLDRTAQDEIISRYAG